MNASRRIIFPFFSDAYERCLLSGEAQQRISRLALRLRRVSGRGRASPALVQRFRNSNHTSGFIELIGPSVDKGLPVDVVDGGQDAIFKLLFGSHSDMAQHGARELGEEAFDEIQPRATGRTGSQSHHY
jgi:hypothetical protein